MHENEAKGVSVGQSRHREINRNKYSKIGVVSGVTRSKAVAKALLGNFL